MERENTSVMHFFRSQFLQIGSLALTIGLLFFQLHTWRSPFLGIAFFIVYLVLVGHSWQYILRRVFGMRQRDWMTRIFSYGIVIVLLSFVAALYVSWYKLTPTGIWSVFLLTAMLSYALFFWIKRHRSWEKRTVPLSGGWEHSVFPKHPGILLAYIAIWGAACAFLLKHRAAESAQSPWQIIDPTYLLLFFVLQILLGLIIFSRHRVTIIMMAVIAQSILLHLYLPLSHRMPWGGDVWRHIGIEEHLQQGRHVYPVLFGDHTAMREIGSFFVPEVLLSPQKYMYAQLWGISVLFSQTLQIDLLIINIWLIPILWSLVVPLLLFRIAAIVFGSWRYGIGFSALVTITFPFQVLGSISLPISLGFISFFLALAWWLQYLRTKNHRQRNLALALGAFMAFGHPVAFLVFWLFIIISGAIHIASQQKSFHAFRQVPPRLLRICVAILVALSLFYIPVLELYTRISNIAGTWDAVHAGKQMLGQFSAWFYASGIRPHDIVSGNIFFNHTPAYAFVPSIFTSWRWPFMPIMFALWIFSVLGAWYSLRRARDMIWAAIIIVAAAVVNGYIIGWFIFSGDRLVTRRLDLLVIFFLLLLAVQGVRSLPRIHGVSQRIALFIIIVFLAWTGTGTYASGPDMQVISSAEYDAAAYVWQEERRHASSYCVLADTWVLLALEAVSGRTIVGGGFPINAQFAQPERMRLYGSTVIQPSEQFLSDAHMHTGASQCWIIIPKELIGDDVRLKITDITSSSVQEVGALYLWRERGDEDDLQNSNEAE